MPWDCTTTIDCPSGYACVANACIAAPDASDCSSGCPSGYICKLAGGQTQCVPAGGLGGDAGTPAYEAGVASDASVGDTGGNLALDAGGSASATSDASGAADGSNSEVASPATDASSASDAAYAAQDGEVLDASLVDASDALAAVNRDEASSAPSDGAAVIAPDAPVQVVCNSNAQCGGAGAKCIDGQCTPEDRLCSDRTQCFVPGDSCVDGICEPHCSAQTPCPGGYACDFNRGVCALNASPCIGSGTAPCQGGSTCVEERCVPPCANADGEPACPDGQLCVHGGCIPDEAAKFACRNDGQSGFLATTCSANAICLHHDCYAACDADAGASACSDPSAVCRQVTVAAGTYLVCGSSDNLGSDCDPAAGRYCSGAVCIDGYCR